MNTPTALLAALLTAFPTTDTPRWLVLAGVGLLAAALAWPSGPDPHATVSRYLRRCPYGKPASAFERRCSSANVISPSSSMIARRSGYRIAWLVTAPATVRSHLREACATPSSVFGGIGPTRPDRVSTWTVSTTSRTRPSIVYSPYVLAMMSRWISLVPP